ncbi:MAG: phosphopantetheine-binding protein [Chthoniobacteraceae bacterium]
MPQDAPSPPKTLEDQLLTLVSERLIDARSGFDLDSNLYEAGLDSMAIMRLLVLVEEEFGVFIPESELTRENFSSVRHLVHLISERKKSSS